MWLALVFFTLTSVTFFLMNALGFMLVPAAVILLRTAAYADKYRREDLGLACFRLGYVGVGLALFARGLLQTRAACTSLRRGCYQPMLPSYWLGAKVGVKLGPTMRNGLSLTFVYLNTRGDEDFRPKVQWRDGSHLFVRSSFICRRVFASRRLEIFTDVSR